MKMRKMSKLAEDWRNRANIQLARMLIWNKDVFRSRHNKRSMQVHRQQDESRTESRVIPTFIWGSTDPHPPSDSSAVTQVVPHKPLRDPLQVFLSDVCVVFKLDPPSSDCVITISRGLCRWGCGLDRWGQEETAHRSAVPDAVYFAAAVFYSSVKQIFSTSCWTLL